MNEGATSNTSGEILIEVFRNQHRESEHRAIWVTDNEKLDRISMDSEQASYLTFFRSAAKLIQAIELVTSGAADYWGLTPEHLAAACASHHGEIDHLQAIEDLLQRINVPASALICDGHPFRSVQQTLKHPCSGKHAAMLAICKYKNWPIDNYQNITHPLQKLNLARLTEYVGSENALPFAIDGCGVPTYVVTLRQMARAYRTFATKTNSDHPDAEAVKRITEAIRLHPYMIAGSSGFDTALISLTDGRIIGKMGAEGIYCAYCTQSNQDIHGFSLKVLDGQERALYPAAIKAFEHIGWLTPSEIDHLSSFAEPDLFNRQQIKIGRIIAKNL